MVAELHYILSSKFLSIDLLYFQGNGGKKGEALVARLGLGQPWQPTGLGSLGIQVLSLFAFFGPGNPLRFGSVLVARCGLDLFEFPQPFPCLHIFPSCLPPAVVFLSDLFRSQGGECGKRVSLFPGRHARVLYLLGSTANLTRDRMAQWS